MVGLALKRMHAEILLPLRDRHRLCRTQVTTDDLPRSAFAIVFSYLRVKLRPTKEKADPRRWNALSSMRYPKNAARRRTDFRD